MLIIRGIEVTQAIQYFRADQHLTDPADRGPDNSLKLIANKAAWARVYVESDAPGTIANVSATLDVAYGIFNTRAGQPALALNPQPPGQVDAPFDPDYATTRGSTALTLNFIIPSGRMFGPLVITANAKTADNSQTATKTVSVSATLRQTLKVRGIMIGYQGPNPANPAQTLTIAAPGLAQLQSTAAWGLRVMPVRATGVFQVASTITRTTPLTGTATNGGCTADWINLNAAIATAKTADGNHPGFLYYGLIAATFPNLSNNGGCESSGVSSGFDGGQVAMTHEIGHACGRPHAPCGGVGTSADPNYPTYEPYGGGSIGEYGLDISTGAVPAPTNGRDYMSYCGPGWISIYTHQALCDNDALNPEYVGIRRPWWDRYVAYDPWWWLHYIPDPPPYWIDPADIRENPVRMQRVISVIGVIHPGERVEVSSVTRTEVVRMDVAGTATGLHAVLLGAGNAELASAPIVAMPSQGDCPCEDCAGDERPRLFQALIPDVAPGTALVVRRGKEQLWKRAATKGELSVSAPKVQRAKEGQVEITWTPRGKAVDTWVRVSADEGKTWKAVATNVEGRRAQIDATHIPAGLVLVQVVVHDGFRSVASAPAKYENPVTAPVPAILHPHEGRRLFSGEVLHLWGSVAEQPGPAREDLRYAWTIDGKAAGEELEVYTRVPAPGTHKCELQVLDAKGKRLSAATVSFVSVAGEDGRRR